MIATLAAVCGIAGAALTTSLLRERRAMGFAVWVVGDAAWIVYGVGEGATALVMQFAVFFLLAVRGVWNNLPVE